MKRLLIGCAALALIGGAQAFAQDTTQPSTGVQPAASAAGSQATRSDTGSAGVGAQNWSGAVLSDGTTGGSTATATGMTSTRSGSGGRMARGHARSRTSATSYQRADASAEAGVTGATTVGDMAQSNPAPGSYPVCSSRKQDRCTVASQTRHMARAGHRSTRTGA